ncbi:MAG: hypothetical protein HFJ24_08900 [Clostridia bacterium]|jgi:hypothetical protein|nr:hypothetical protein [Clostridia bacterium]MCI9276002.1 hypothetical protein [Clostridia bacterium]
MKIKNKFIFIIALLILIILMFTNTSYGASVEAFNTWVEKNQAQLTVLLEGYDYVVINNFYQNKVRIYYTLAPNNKFYINEEAPFVGSRRFLRSRSDWGQNYYYYYTFNENGDNNFVLPISLSKDKIHTDNIECSINDYNVNNVIYSSSDVYGTNCEKVIATKKALPLLLTKVVVGEIVKVEQITEIVSKVTQMIVPTGLVIFGILFVILLIKSVISRAT